MPYLQAVIKEALRLHPAVGLPLWRDVPAGGTTISGKYLPAGTTVGINGWVAHYNTEVYGSDVRDFRPERWIEASEERTREMDGFYLPVSTRFSFKERLDEFANMMQFGLGSRTCIGRHISMLEISKLIPWLVRSFDFELKDPDEQLDTTDYWFVKPKSLNVRLRIRDGEALSNQVHALMSTSTKTDQLLGYGRCNL
jgi:cytochrome P450